MLKQPKTENMTPTSGIEKTETFPHSDAWAKVETNRLKKKQSKITSIYTKYVTEES